VTDTTNLDAPNLEALNHRHRVQDAVSAARGAHADGGTDVDVYLRNVLAAAAATLGHTDPAIIGTAVDTMNDEDTECWHDGSCADPDCCGGPYGTPTDCTECITDALDDAIDYVAGQTQPVA
jgi:hypothetical protein